MAKKYDMALKVGEYQSQDGVTRGRYEALGEIHPGRDGGFFARINAFRMLGVAMAAVARGDDAFIVSLFPPRSADGSTAATPPAAPRTPSAPPAPRPPATVPDFDTDIPF